MFKTGKLSAAEHRVNSIIASTMEKSLHSIAAGLREREEWSTFFTLLGLAGALKVFSEDEARKWQDALQ